MSKAGERACFAFLGGLVLFLGGKEARGLQKMVGKELVVSGFIDLLGGFEYLFKRSIGSGSKPKVPFWG